MFEMLIGLPASGKSYYALKLVEKGYIRHSSDEIRKQLFGADGYSKQEQAAVFDELHKRVIADLKQGKNVVYDATNLSRKKRMVFMDMIKDIDTGYEATLFVDDISNLKKRNAEREESVPEDVYDRMIRQFDPPMYFEGFDHIDVIVNDEVENAGKYKDFSVLKNIPHDSKYHSETIGDHMETAVKIMEKYTADNCLLAAAWLHDIGKPYVKSFLDNKGNETKYARYYCHEHVGSYLWLLTWEADKYYTLDDALRIANLIDMHMRPFAWEKSVKAAVNDMNMIGENEFKNLLLLNLADRCASNC